MSELFNWNSIDASNTDLWPEGMLGGQINDAGRSMQGLLARHYADHDGSRSSSGSSNAFAVTSSRTIAALFDNLTLVFTANHTITGAATLNLNTIGAKSIKRFNGSALASGDIVSGQPVTVIYKSSPDVWFMMSAAAALTGNMFADFDENAAPGDPAADDARLYAYDDGGETVLAWRDSAGVISDLRIATQAQMETPNDGRIVRADRQHFHPGHPKAGGNLNGTGTPAFRTGDYGMGAVTDNGVGNYTLAFDTAFADTNYWCAGWARSDSDVISSGICTSRPGATKTASSFQVRTQYEDGSTRSDLDSSEVGISFWGDYA